jgi:hypothetical protein
MLADTSGVLLPKSDCGRLSLTPPRVREITASELVDELNRVVDLHNAMAADFLRCLLWLSLHLALSRRKAAQFEALLEENNRLLYLAQQAQAWRDENDHLWSLIADLNAELNQRGRHDAGE